MKMKKMLAILAALSVLGTTGLTVGAEDTATTTEPATEAITTTETEAETTAAETTAETETTVETDVTEETAATEENQTVQEKGIFEAGSKDYQIEQNGTVHNVKVVVQFNYETITTGVVTDAYLIVYVDGTQAGEFSMGGATLHDDYWKEKVSDTNIDNYFSVNGDVMNVTINNKTTAYRYDETNKTLIEANNTTETPEDGVYVHGTKTYQMGEHTLKVVVYYDSNEGDDLVERMSVYVDGVLSNLSGVAVTSALAGDETSHEYRANVDNFFAVVDSDTVAVTSYGVTTEYIYTSDNRFIVNNSLDSDVWTFGTKTYQMGEHVVRVVLWGYSTKSDDFDEVEYMSIYVDGKLSNLSKVKVGTVIAGTSEGMEARENVDLYFEISGTNQITVTDRSYKGVSTKYTYNAATNTFVAGSTTDDNQEKTFTVEIPYAYFTVIDSVTGEVVTRPGANKSMVNAAVTSCTNGNVASLNYGNEADNSSLDAFLQSITVSDVKPGTLTIKGTCQSYSSLTPEEKAAGYTTLPHCGDAIENYFTLTVTIDENGNIVTGDSGKTDNGSASNAPASTATKNTSSTPKTGDMTTVPAVAVGLTLTAAGVVAFISKRKK